jgi:hypothetical protein
VFTFALARPDRWGIGAIAGVCVVLSAAARLASAQSVISSISKQTVALSPKKLTFGKVPAGSMSALQTVTLTNNGSVELAAPAVDISTGFAIEDNECNGVIAASGGTCSVSVAFVPLRKGKFKHGLLRFTEAVLRKPQKVKLIGIGIAAAATPTATASPSATPSETAKATATATATHTATPTRTFTATPTATASPGVNVVFVTSQVYDGSIDGTGLSGADSACQMLANNAGLPTGTYKAWLSSSRVDAVTRLGSARAFVRVDGAPIADQLSDLTSGKILNPIDLDESGNDISEAENSDVWTGSTNVGTLSPYGSCNDWTSISGMVFGESGHFDGGPAQWSDNNEAFDCGDNGQLHLYCFDTSHAEQLTYTPVSGRVAFVSKTDFDPSTGIAMADKICQTEASGAGLANADTFMALLSTSTASAASRFDMTIGSKPFVRPDGIKIADAPSLAMGAISSGIWQYADGTYSTVVDQDASTGSTAPNLTGNLTDTCDDWSSEASTEIVGSSTETAIWWDELSGWGCAPRPVYCLEP